VPFIQKGYERIVPIEVSIAILNHIADRHLVLLNNSGHRPPFERPPEWAAQALAFPRGYREGRFEQVRSVGRVERSATGRSRRRFGGLRFAHPSYATTSEIPRTDQFKTCRFEVRHVPGRQAPAIDAGNGRDHSVGCGHGSALSERPHL
jgi:hypothetical protein